MDKDAEERLSQYYGMATQFRMHKNEFIKQIEANHKTILDEDDELLYENMKSRSRRRVLLCGSSGPTIATLLLYYMRNQTFSSRTAITILALTSALPFCYIKLNQPSTYTRKIEEYLFVKYAKLEEDH